MHMWLPQLQHPLVSFRSKLLMSPHIIESFLVSLRKSLQDTPHREKHGQQIRASHKLIPVNGLEFPASVLHHSCCSSGRRSSGRYWAGALSLSLFLGRRCVSRNFCRCLNVRNNSSRNCSTANEHRGEHAETGTSSRRETANSSSRSVGITHNSSSGCGAASDSTSSSGKIEWSDSSGTSIYSSIVSCMYLKGNTKGSSNSESSSYDDLMAGTWEQVQTCGFLRVPRRLEEDEIRSEVSMSAELAPTTLPLKTESNATAVTAESCSCDFGGDHFHQLHRESSSEAACKRRGDLAAVKIVSSLAATTASDSPANLAAATAPLSYCAVADHTHHQDISTAVALTPALLIVAGPSGVGKGTLIKRILRLWPNAFQLSVSHTTRAPRPGEQQGREYYFCTAEEFDALKKQQGFLEYATFSGNYYGTSLAAVRTIQSHGCICLLEIDLEGVRQVQESPLAQQARFVFIKPPSLSELERRLRGRKTESEKHIQMRLDTARRELSLARELHFDANIINADLEEAWDCLHEKLITWFGPRLQQQPQVVPQQPPQQQQHEGRQD